MQSYKSSVNKNSNITSDEENFHRHIQRRCDLKCYKCRYQGICVIPRRLIEAGKRSIRNNIFGNMSLINNKYRFNDFLKILGYKKKILGYLVTNLKKKLYSKDSILSSGNFENTKNSITLYLNNKFRRYKKAKA
jgi:hypothetical protein